MRDDDDKRSPLEVTARREIARLIDSIELGPRPLRPPFDRLPTTQRASRRGVMVGAGLGAAAAAVGAIVVAEAVQTDTPATDVVIGSSGEEECGARVRQDGTVGAGVMPGGSEWEFRIEQEGEWLNGWVYVDGRRSGGWGHDDSSWPSVVNGGRLGVDLLPVEDGWVLSVLAPPGSATVTLDLVDGGELVLCPVAAPVTTAVEFAAGFVRDGVEIRGLRVNDARGRRVAWADEVPPLAADDDWSASNARLRTSLPGAPPLPPGQSEKSVISFVLRIDPDLVPLPLGGTTVPDYVDPLATAVEVASGDLPGGRWSVSAGSNGDEMAIELTRPDGTSTGQGGTLDQIERDVNWEIELIEDRYVLWGFAPDDVATVVVSLGGGTDLRVATMRPGVAGLDLPVFAAVLPESAAIADVAGYDASGAVRHRADLTNLDELVGSPEHTMVGLLVEPVG